jgi:hypothetical protein
MERKEGKGREGKGREGKGRKKYFLERNSRYEPCLSERLIE